MLYALNTERFPASIGRTYALLGFEFERQTDELYANAPDHI
jgi:hypothetical protein